MIIGGCPYGGCDGDHMIPCAPGDMCPCFSKETCETCGRAFWLKHSRWNPEAFTEDEFAEKYVLDEDTKQYKERNPAPPLMPLEEERMADKIIEKMLYGEPGDQPVGIIGTSPIAKAHESSKSLAKFFEARREDLAKKPKV